MVARLKALGYEATVGDLRLKLAREFGFCYGVDRAVDYAYQTRRRFPDRRVFLFGEIIHNPDVNHRLRTWGSRSCRTARIRRPASRRSARRRRDPAGLRRQRPSWSISSTKGCVLVDTTCGSVLNVWKKVHRYARDGYTVIIHGKHYHEETRATASQALTHASGHYLCVRDIGEAELVCDFMRGTVSAADLIAHSATRRSPGFDPARDLERIGLANQTTMLMSETLKCRRCCAGDGRSLRRGGARASLPRLRHDLLGDAGAPGRRARNARRRRSRRMIVIGGYNSSNTQALARMCAPRVTTYYIDSPACVEASGIRHRPVGGGAETLTPGGCREAR